MYFMLDNYDSFVYNLSAYVKELGRNPGKKGRPDHGGRGGGPEPEGIIISPGPGKALRGPSLSHALLGPVRR